MNQSPTGISQTHPAPKVSRSEVAMHAVENTPGAGATVETWFHAKDICIQGSGKEFHRRESKDRGRAGARPRQEGLGGRQSQGAELAERGQPYHLRRQGWPGQVTQGPEVCVRIESNSQHSWQPLVWMKCEERRD